MHSRRRPNIWPYDCGMLLLNIGREVPFASIIRHSDICSEDMEKQVKMYKVIGIQCPTLHPN